MNIGACALATSHKRRNLESMMVVGGGLGSIVGRIEFLGLLIVCLLCVNTVNHQPTSPPLTSPFAHASVTFSSLPSPLPMSSKEVPFFRQLLSSRGHLSSGLSLVAIDFDKTYVNVHTLGRWSGSAESLAENVRPFFVSLIKQAVANKVVVAIVTSSMQVALITKGTEWEWGGDVRVWCKPMSNHVCICLPTSSTPFTTQP